MRVAWYFFVVSYVSCRVKVVRLIRSCGCTYEWIAEFEFVSKPVLMDEMQYDQAGVDSIVVAVLMSAGDDTIVVVRYDSVDWLSERLMGWRNRNGDRRKGHFVYSCWRGGRWWKVGGWSCNTMAGLACGGAMV